MNRLKIVKENEEFDSHREEWLALLSDYIGGIMPVERRDKVKAHLEECQKCAADLEGMRQAVQMLNRLPEVTPPRSFALTPLQARRLKPSPYYRATQVVAAIAAVFLLFAFALDFAGTFKAAEEPPVSAAQTAEPTATLPPVGTLNPSGDSASAGPNQGLAITVAPFTTSAANPTAIPLNTQPPAPAAESGLPVIRLVQIGLALTTVLLLALAFALRPRAPGRFRI